MSETKVNREYKDRLFRMIFGSEEMKENMVSLYNALNGTSFTVDDDVKITTMSDVVYMSMKNDVSLIIDSYLSLWEQQSTFNPNMPLRGLLYFGNVYEAYVAFDKEKLYSSKLYKIPTPRYIVFYNGKVNQEAVIELRLSDAFIHNDESGKYEWTATLYNLNKGKNDELLEKCKPLKDYMTFVNYVREYQGKRTGKEALREAVDKAVDRCIAEGILKDFLLMHRAEVKDVVLTEFDEEKFYDCVLEQGREEGILLGIKRLLNAGMRENYILKLGYTPEEVEKAKLITV